MPSVPLRFLPPDAENLVSMKVWEAPTSDGTFTLKETVNSIGVYPDYIDSHTTTFAASVDDWFAISWVDSAGAESGLSAPIQGGTTTLVSILVDRVMQRDRSLSQSVVRQESESAIQVFLGETVDPYDPELANELSYVKLNGLTYMVLARCLIMEMIESGELEKAQIGLVSFSSQTSSTKMSDVEALIELANKALGIGTSVVLQMADISRCHGFYEVFAP